MNLQTLKMLYVIEPALNLNVFVILQSLFKYFSILVFKLYEKLVDFINF